MRLLRYSGALFSVVLIACPAPEDDDNPFQMTTTTTTPMTTEPTPDPTTMSVEESTSEGGEISTGPSDSTGASSGDTTEGAEGSECTVGQSCGNGCIEGSEQCDCGGEFCTPAGLGGAQCFGLSQVLPTGETRYYTGGILDCNPASCQFNFLQCTFCGDKNLNGMELCEVGDTGPSCQALGMGSSTAPLPCGPNCLQWDTTCCATPLPKECQ